MIPARHTYRTSNDQRAWEHFHDYATTEPPVASTTATHIDEIFGEKVRRGLFAPVARHVYDYPDPEDRLQDAIAQTWMLYRRNALERGQILSDAVLTVACKRYARDYRSRFVPGERCKRAEDVLDPRAVRYGVRLTSDDAASTRDDPDLSLAYQALRGELGDLDRDVLDGLLDGRTTRDLGAELNLSSSSVTRRTAFIRAKAAKHLYTPRSATLEA